MAYFTDMVLQLESLGILDVLLPFLLIFTISFAVLNKSKVLGKDSKRFNVIISVVFAFAAIIPHVIGGQPDVVPIINSALPNVSLLMIASMMVLILIGVFGSDVNVGGTDLAGIVVLFSIVAVGWVFMSSAGLVNTIPFLQDPQTRSMLVAVLVFAVVVWFITAEPNEESKGFQDFFGGMGKVLGNGGHGGSGGHH
jgi:hypothetical protein